MQSFIVYSNFNWTKFYEQDFNGCVNMAGKIFFAKLIRDQYYKATSKAYFLIVLFTTTYSSNIIYIIEKTRVYWNHKKYLRSLYFIKNVYLLYLLYLIVERSFRTLQV